MKQQSKRLEYLLLEQISFFILVPKFFHVIGEKVLSVFLKHLISQKIWNFFFSCFLALSRSLMIFEKTSRPSSKVFALYDFDVFFKAVEDLFMFTLSRITTLNFSWISMVLTYLIIVTVSAMSLSKWTSRFFCFSVEMLCYWIAMNISKSIFRIVSLKFSMKQILEYRAYSILVIQIRKIPGIVLITKG